MSQHPTRIVVDLEAIRANVRTLRARVHARAAIMAVVKANAYGHGDLAVARAALEAGASWCGVSSLEEAVRLREGGVRAPILVMGYTPPSAAADVLRYDVRITLFSLADAAAFASVARARQQPIRAHVKLDTGMGRLGFLPAEAPSALEALLQHSGLVIEGAFTHLCCAESDPDFSRHQIAQFDALTKAYRSLTWRHACNSAGTLCYPEGHFDLVRTGLITYGLSPWGMDAPPPGVMEGFRPALSLRTCIVSLKTLPDGAGVGYGARYRCAGERRIAVIPIGYGDGFRRSPSNFGEALVRGRRAPVVGNVCMDQSMLDVTHIPEAQAGDEVVVIGQQGTDCITAEEIADRLGTINYEVVTALTARPRREYLGAKNRA